MFNTEEYTQEINSIEIIFSNFVVISILLTVIAYFTEPAFKTGILTLIN